MPPLRFAIFGTGFWARFQLAAWQELAGAEYRKPDTWARKAILNVARMGKFSSDRTISEYAGGIWGLEPQDD